MLNDGLNTRNNDIQNNFSEIEVKNKSEQTQRSIQRIQIVSFPFVLATAVCLAGIAGQLTAEPTKKGWEIFTDKNFHIRAGIVTILANLGFAIVGNTAVDLFINHVKDRAIAVISHEHPSLDLNILESIELTGLIKKNYKLILRETVISYIKGAFTFYTFPYFATATHQIMPEIAADVTTTLTITTIFNALNKFTLPLSTLSQLAPGIFGLMLGNTIVENFRQENPLAENEFDWLKVFIPAATAFVTTLPSTAVNLAIPMTSSIFSIFNRVKTFFTYQLPEEEKPLLIDIDNDHVDETDRKFSP